MLEYLQPEDMLEDAGFDVHRWSAEPVFARMGAGYLKPATEKDKAAEMAHYDRLLRKLRKRAEREAASLDSSQL